MHPQFLPPPEIAGAPQPLWTVIVALLLTTITVTLMLVTSSILL